MCPFLHFPKTKLNRFNVVLGPNVNISKQFLISISLFEALEELKNQVVMRQMDIKCLNFQILCFSMRQQRQRSGCASVLSGQHLFVRFKEWIILAIQAKTRAHSRWGAIANPHSTHKSQPGAWPWQQNENSVQHVFYLSLVRTHTKSLV